LRPVARDPQSPLRDVALVAKTTEQPIERATGAPPALFRAGDVDADYLPRSALTAGPRPQTPVVIDYPYFDGEADRYAGEFDVFIDDTGGVVRVASATPDLPGILANAVREAFLTARFSPGEVEGRPVRSRMRIEVTFDSRRLPSS
jgi:protein TonB